MENKKSVLITIIVLLCIFAPLTIIGLLGKENISPIEENPNHDTYFDGYIWFYNTNDEFLSKYECLTEICEYTVPIIDDNTYGLNYYKEGTVDRVSLINDKYTFITDGQVIYLYAAETGTKLQTYNAIKTYNSNLENNSYIVKNSDGVWGVLSISETLGSVLPFEYSFIGLKNDLNEDGTISTDKFIVQKDTKWYIVDNNNSSLSGYIDDPIIDYNNDYIISSSVDKIRIYSYEDYEYLTNYNIKDYIFEDKYIGIITDTFLLIYENLGEKYIKSIAIADGNSNFDLKMDNNKLNILNNDKVVDTIEVN